MKALIIGVEPSTSPYTYQISRLISEFEKRNVIGNYCYFGDIKINFNSEPKITFNNKDIGNYEIIIIRNNLLPGADIIAQELENKGRFLLNSVSLKSFPGNYNKLTQYYRLNEAKVSIPETFFAYDYKNYQTEDLNNYLVKPYNGSLGNNISKLSQELMDNSAVDINNNLLMQKMLDTNFDYRVIVLDSKAYGCMKKTKQNGSIASNYAAGGLIENSPLNDELSSLAIETAKALNLEFCGVDIMEDSKGKYYVLEANRNALFEGFESVTNIDLAGKIVDYCISKVKKF